MNAKSYNRNSKEHLFPFASCLGETISLISMPAATSITSLVQTSTSVDEYESNAQITGDGAFTHIAVHKDYPLVGGCQRDGQVNGHVAFALLWHRGSNQDGFAVTCGGEKLQVASL